MSSAFKFSNCGQTPAQCLLLLPIALALLLVQSNSAYVVILPSKEAPPCLITALMDSQDDEDVIFSHNIFKSSNTQLKIEIIDDSGKVIKTITNQRSSNFVISRSKIEGNYLHVCLYNKIGEKQVQIQVTPDFESITNTVFDGESGKNFDANSNDKNSHLLNGFRSTLKQIERYRESMKRDEFLVQSMTDLSGVRRKVTHTSVVSLILVLVFFIFMYVWIKYIVNNSEKAD